MIYIICQQDLPATNKQIHYFTNISEGLEKNFYNFSPDFTKFKSI